MSLKTQVDENLISALKEGKELEVSVLRLLKAVVLNKEKGVFEIKEKLPQNIDLINPLQPNQITYLNGIKAEFLKYSLEIPENKISTIEYTIKPKSLGSYTISPTSVTSDATYISNSAEFTVSCIPDNVCSEGENNLYCPEDCSTSIPDGICNPKLDSSCDPDCESDPDCKNSQSSFPLRFF